MAVVPTGRIAPPAAVGGQDQRMGEADLAAANAAKCFAASKTAAEKAEKEAKECKEQIQKACQEVPSGLKEGDKCGAAEKDAKKKKEEAAKKEKGAGDNAKKNEDNKKKEESAGGMPQMPQIPQMPQQKEDTPQDLATSPTPDSTVASSTAPQIETSKLGDGQSDLAAPQIGIGIGTSTDTKVGLTPNQAFPVQSYASENAFRTPSTNGLDGAGASNVSAASSPAGGGGGGSGGGGGNTSGSSRPGEGGDTAKAPDAANPYEVAVGSGGRLGVPKGKTTAEPDAPIDAAATANFNGDFKVDPAGGEQTAGAGEEEEPGYTIFKMVKYRYSELKKKGNI